MTDFKKRWLREGFEECRKRTNKLRMAMARMKRKEGRYYEAHDCLLEAWQRAEDIFTAYLKLHERGEA